MVGIIAYSICCHMYDLSGLGDGLSARRAQYAYAARPTGKLLNTSTTNLKCHQYYFYILTTHGMIPWH